MRKLRLSRFVLPLLALPLFAAALPVSKPDDVGLSPERLKRIHSMIQSHIDAKDFSGAVSLVARKGKVVHFEAHGMADVEGNKPMRTDTLFRLASMTKPLTAASILMLVEEGKLVISDPVSKFIPEYKNPKVAVWNLPNDPAGAGLHLVPANREITVQDLLTHTSGLANAFEGPAGDYVRRANLPRGGSLAERVSRLAKLPLNFQPGTQWEYSPGTGFDTLGRIVEILSGMSLEKFFQTRIFEPLGMKDTFFTVPQNRRTDQAIAYTKDDKGLVRPRAAAAPAAPEPGGEYFSGSGGLTGSTQDYLTFAQMLLNGGTLNGTRLLSRKTVELMTSDAIGPLDLRNYAGDQVLKGYGFGLGVRIRRSTGESGWMGSPGDFGWAGALGTYFWIDPKEQLIGIVMIQTRNTRLRMEFPNTVYQAISD
ncbi:MAG TPA: serine hydrolase domain-containing protein [Bryobacteraceae bacterium]|jgi:CubicO group peptidase (beta-lactamase class C family)|nr:serine hydrolase domain-containing protein [Bryobacteraceae bacterium]